MNEKKLIAEIKKDDSQAFEELVESFKDSVVNTCYVFLQNTEDEEVQFLSISVTPEIDSVEVLKKYAIANSVQSGKWHLITGDRKSIYAIACDSYFTDEDMDLQNLENEFLHT